VKGIPLIEVIWLIPESGFNVFARFWFGLFLDLT